MSMPTELEAVTTRLSLITGADTKSASGARQALIALLAYVDGGKIDDPAEPVAALIGDLLVDLHHLADRAGIDFDMVQEWAGRHHRAETDPETTPAYAR